MFARKQQFDNETTINVIDDLRWESSNSTCQRWTSFEMICKKVATQPQRDVDECREGELQEKSNSMRWQGPSWRWFCARKIVILEWDDDGCRVRWFVREFHFDNETTMNAVKDEALCTIIGYECSWFDGLPWESRNSMRRRWWRGDDSLWESNIVITRW